METVCNIGEIAVKQNKVFALNLSAPFICDAYKLSVVQVLYYCDIIFGNETEALTLGSLLFDVDTVPQTIYELMDFPKHNKSRSRLVVITQGCKPILYAKGE